MDSVRVHVSIEGRVQGVWFRASTRDVALRLGLSGWVRNLPTGGVEAEFEGPRERVEQAVEWCRHGPPGARVTRCDPEWGEPVGASVGFKIRYD
jgi:acylphosphatase